MSIVLMGSTSGSCTLSEQAVAGSTTLTLPTITGTVGILVSGTAVASTSGTSIDFTSIPAGVRRITVMFAGVSTSSTSGLLIQIGDSGGIENTGYTSSASYTTASTNSIGSTAGYVITYLNDAGSIFNGALVLNCLNSSANTWTSNGSLSWSGTFTGMQHSAGSKSLSATLDRIRITTINGTDTFDAGSINILYE